MGSIQVSIHTYRYMHAWPLFVFLLKEMGQEERRPQFNFKVRLEEDREGYMVEQAAYVA
jgi:hypothetical protein